MLKCFLSLMASSFFSFHSFSSSQIIWKLMSIQEESFLLHEEAWPAICLDSESCSCTPNPLKLLCSFLIIALFSSAVRVHLKGNSQHSSQGLNWSHRMMLGCLKKCSHSIPLKQRGIIELSPSGKQEFIFEMAQNKRLLCDW